MAASTSNRGAAAGDPAAPLVTPAGEQSRQSPKEDEKNVRAKSAKAPREHKPIRFPPLAPPAGLTCPISGMLMQEPVQLRNGICYDLENIRLYVGQYGKDFVSGEVFHSTTSAAGDEDHEAVRLLREGVDYKPHDWLKETIASWKRRNNHRPEERPNSKNLKVDHVLRRLQFQLNQLNKLKLKEDVENSGSAPAPGIGDELLAKFETFLSKLEAEHRARVGTNQQEAGPGSKMFLGQHGRKGGPAEGTIPSAHQLPTPGEQTAFHHAAAAVGGGKMAGVGSKKRSAEDVGVASELVRGAVVPRVDPSAPLFGPSGESLASKKHAFPDEDPSLAFMRSQGVVVPTARTPRRQPGVPGADHAPRGEDHQRGHQPGEPPRKIQKSSATAGNKNRAASVGRARAGGTNSRPPVGTIPIAMFDAAGGAGGAASAAPQQTHPQQGEFTPFQLWLGSKNLAPPTTQESYEALLYAFNAEQQAHAQMSVQAHAQYQLHQAQQLRQQMEMAAAAAAPSPTTGGPTTTMTTLLPAGATTPRGTSSAVSLQQQQQLLVQQQMQQQQLLLQQQQQQMSLLQMQQMQQHLTENMTHNSDASGGVVSQNAPPPAPLGTSNKMEPPGGGRRGGGSTSSGGEAVTAGGAKVQGATKVQGTRGRSGVAKSQAQGGGGGGGSKMFLSSTTPATTAPAIPPYGSFNAAASDSLVMVGSAGGVKPKSTAVDSGAEKPLTKRQQAMQAAAGKIGSVAAAPKTALGEPDSSLQVQPSGQGTSMLLTPRLQPEGFVVPGPEYQGQAHPMKPSGGLVLAPAGEGEQMGTPTAGTTSIAKIASGTTGASAVPVASSSTATATATSRRAKSQRAAAVAAVAKSASILGDGTDGRSTRGRQGQPTARGGAPSRAAGNTAAAAAVIEQDPAVSQDLPHHALGAAERASPQPENAPALPLTKRQKAAQAARGPFGTAPNATTSSTGQNSNAAVADLLNSLDSVLDDHRLTALRRNGVDENVNDEKAATTLMTTSTTAQNVGEPATGAGNAASSSSDAEGGTRTRAANGNAAAPHSNIAEANFNPLFGIPESVPIPDLVFKVSGVTRWPKMNGVYCFDDARKTPASPFFRNNATEGMLWLTLTPAEKVSNKKNKWVHTAVIGPKTYLNLADAAACETNAFGGTVANFNGDWCEAKVEKEGGVSWVPVDETKFRIEWCNRTEHPWQFCAVVWRNVLDYGAAA